MGNIFYGHAPLKSGLFLLDLDCSDTHIHNIETFGKFKEFQSEVEYHRNNKIKFLRTNCGGEYLSYEFGLHLN